MYSARPLIGNQNANLIRVANSQVARGSHAFGLAWSTDGGIDAFKRAGAITEHPRDVLRASGSTAIIGHTRWATHGDASDNLNNHPHAFMHHGERGYLVHNGIIGNYQRIAQSRGLTLGTECDSEVLARHIEDNNGDILSRVRDAVADVDATAPFAMALLVPEGLVLARRGNPLYWSNCPNRAWFASTSASLIGRIYEVPDDNAFLIPSGDGKVTSVALRKREYSTRRWVGSDLFA
jgi:glucosamine--fructose-6-phosphate aminotransferase (isomerizing)